MSVKHSLLALLEEGPMYGYQLRAEFERRTGGTWPLNVGQVYTTLTRLERDGLVEPQGDDEEGHRVFAVTEAGRSEVAEWFGTPVDRTQPQRDELAIKLALAVTVPGIDVGVMIQRQRAATIGALQGYTRLKVSAAAGGATQAISSSSGGTTGGATAELAWSLVLDALVFDAEAEVRWLDHCEARLRRAAAERRADAPASTQPVTPVTSGEVNR